MIDQCVRLSMAIIVIALISLALYQFSGRARAAEPAPYRTAVKAAGLVMAKVVPMTALVSAAST